MAAQLLAQLKGYIDVEDFPAANSLSAPDDLSDQQRLRYRYLQAKSKSKQFKYQAALDDFLEQVQLIQKADLHSDPQLMCPVLNQIVYVYVQALEIKKASLIVEQCMELASHDPFHRLRQQFMCYARFLKWTGSWPEALNEIDRIEEQVAAKLEEHEKEPFLFTKYLKLNARLLKERMILLAMTKRFEEA